MGVSPERISAYTLRDSVAADAEALALLGRETFVETFGPLYSPEDLSAYLAKAYEVAQQRRDLQDATLYNIVAEAAGTPVGYAKAGPCNLPVDTAGMRAYELYRLYVRASHQGLGIGDALMEAVIAQARHMGAEALFLGMWEENHKAFAFYRRHGFEQVGEYIFYVGAQADRELILKKML